MPNQMELKQINLHAGSATWLSITSSKAEANSTIHVSAANGFTPACYYSFFTTFSSHLNFTGMDCRGSWPNIASPSNGFGMHNFADDLIEGLEKQHNKPVIGLGHSLGGAITLLAAIKRPDLFSTTRYSSGFSPLLKGA